MSKEIIQSIKIRTANFYHDLLWTKEGKEALKYVHSRGISDNTIRTMCIGYSPGGNKLKTHLEELGFDIWLAVDSGLIRMINQNSIIDYFNNYVVFPLFVESGVSTFTGRSLNPDPNYRYKHLHLKRAQKQLYNYNIISKSKVVMLVESPFNALSLIE